LLGKILPDACDRSGHSLAFLLYIDPNEFYSTASGGGGTAAIYLSTGTSANIYNNTFINTNKGRTIAILYPPRPNSNDQMVRIYNNSFYNDATAINLRNGN